ncbi:MAG TPA: VWA domain-containing protein [Deltaproteobacteria bacterium]|jgi:hypothetical protein|nr:VWA domain-containing protein [Deltaproteobacteria bacterium]HQI01241.1 VWA domain-containing protein [Deltaproteobacteria bacterium]HQJ09567.1 VWA domain-containing protein [Deltaproteobacteria bacterium]
MRTNLNDQGWALMYAVIFCVIIQGIALITCNFISHNAKSGNTFKELLSQQHTAALAGMKPSSRGFLLNAPEGWDHLCFSTEVTERQWGNESMYSWRIRMNEQPVIDAANQRLSCWAPSVIILVDDSKSMLTSGGYSYDEGTLYLERTGGEIVPAGERDDVTRTLTAPEGTYFRGGYGNVWYQAHDMYHFGGAMQCWTSIMAYLTNFIEDMDMCSIAVATVSGGIVQPFTNDRKALLSAVNGIQPRSHESRLAEALLRIIGEFPNTCSTSKHIIIATSGIAVHDGNIPSSIRDFDGDGNPLDAAIETEGSHCLDDVAAYAASKGVHVHVAGPSTPFLKRVYGNGGGAYMPAKSYFGLPAPFIAQMPSIQGKVQRFLTNIDLAFMPEWAGFDATAYNGLMHNGTPHLGPVPKFNPKGTATSLYMEGSKLLCATSRDDLLSFDMATGACSWIAGGVGGRIKVRNGMIITGPNIQGNITVLSSRPEIGWMSQGETFTASQESVYIARGSNIVAYTLDGGMFRTQFNADSKICVLEYDPCSGSVLAGSQSGLIYVLGQDLLLKTILTPGLPGTLRSIRSFSLRKELCIAALTDTSAVCLTPLKTLWKTDLDGGICTNALVMDNKLFITSWAPGDCEGIDSGSSTLLVLDAKSGERVSRTPLFEAKAFGPVLDLDAGVLKHASWKMDLRQTDISTLAGMKSTSLGYKIKHKR